MAERTAPRDPSRGAWAWGSATPPRALHERLGYVTYGRGPASWDEEGPDGSITHCETVCTLRKEPS